MNVIRYQPWAFHRALLKEFNRSQDVAPGESSANGPVADWSPALDVEEYADRFVLTADVPGVDPATIEVTLEKGVLKLGGSRPKPAEASPAERRRIERVSGQFSRRVSLPDTLDSEAVTARTSNGVLEIVIPKRPAIQPRRIAVSH